MGTRISPLDVTAPAQRWPPGSITEADDSRELSASLNSSTTSPGAVPSTAPDRGDEDTNSAWAETGRGVARATLALSSVATANRPSQRWMGATLRGLRLPGNDLMFSGIGTIRG